MDLLLILTYTALCIAIFRIFNIPLTKWTVPTAILGGVLLIGTLILVMNYNHPHANIARNVYITTPIIPNVRGIVTDITVKPNEKVKAGDLLFSINDTPYQAKVNEATAQLQDAIQVAKGLEASFKSAQASTLRAKAEYFRSKLEFDRYQEGAKKGAYSKGSVDNMKGVYYAAKATYEASQAEEDRQRIAFESEVNGKQTIVAQAEARLEQAQFNLDSTNIYAPTDGYVTQLTLRPGMMAVPMPLRPVMSFVHDEEAQFVALFRQNSALRLKPGYKADFIFKAIPGKAFAGEIVSVLPAMAEGQVQAQGTLMSSKNFNRNGQVVVVLKLIDDMSEYDLPKGTSAEIAVYSDHFEHVSVMRKVLIRMKSWQNYLFLDH
ncbi:membrane fusion protein (MFP) component of efflux pump, signal anchor [Pseudoalteromonas sp. 3J6]|jgi:multidrug resistance efflux pump|uniref:HlyD family secretion protein n=1 Tax=unclassified Pseudoalteromonas TaxID=194690 RepID=UPI00176D6CC4|nr:MULTISPECIES: HlyD family secretion protein [unclassified Pseudoalteromonas]MDN3484404.1 HlyD family secretion protein [Pseudoalteromonas sp. APC 3224]CAD2223740.1 membrane fusion protein (MFP) component of efflux pump, signal anchor [Pseudoalteromonas sp. 3J6]